MQHVTTKKSKDNEVVTADNTTIQILQDKLKNKLSIHCARRARSSKNFCDKPAERGAEAWYKREPRYKKTSQEALSTADDVQVVDTILPNLPGTPTEIFTVLECYGKAGSTANPPHHVP